MIKQIKLNGLSAIPSDYDCPDGDLSMSVNHIAENGALVPLSQPTVIRSIPEDYKVVCIHRAAGIDNIIVIDSSSNELLFARSIEPDAEFIQIAPWTGASRPAVSVIGNSLVLSDSSITLYILWSPDKDSYISLGDSIPEISISFALAHKLSDSKKDFSISIPLSSDLPYDTAIAILNDYQIWTSSSSNYIEKEFMKAFTTSVMAALNKFVADAADENRFLQPFMVRWALRMFDGSHIHHSAPILMIPNSEAPIVSYSSQLASKTGNMVSLPISIEARQCSLMFRVSNLSSLMAWKDIIAAIDIFVSPQVFTYDQSESIGSIHSVAAEGFSFSGVASEITALTSSSRKQYLFPQGNTQSRIIANGQFFNPARFSRSHIEKDISDISSFYLISSIPLFDDGDDDSITESMQGFSYLDIPEGALSALQARSRLEDDYRSHERISFSHAFGYNSRAVLSGIASSIFNGFSLTDMGQFGNDDSSNSYVASIYVKISRNDASYWVAHKWHPIYTLRLPRFLFYPDPNASEMRIFIRAQGATQIDGYGYRVSLRPHDFLNGAFAFIGLVHDARFPYFESLDTPQNILDESVFISQPAKIFISEVNNPFFIPLNGRVTVGSSNVMATCAAVRALSQGQFGQFPLYAFTSEGVWALSIASSGVVSAVQPLSRDVCDDPQSITQIDSAVVFSSPRGIILLAGASSDCISDKINTPPVKASLPLPKFNDLVQYFGMSDFKNSFPSAPFSQFISKCGFIFDYVNQHLLIFNPLFPYAYVFSLKSKNWGMIESFSSYSVPSYPKAFAVDSYNNLVDFSARELQPSPGFFITRPIKLDAPDLLKTVDTVISHGHFMKGDIVTVLYGSPDLSHWYLVASSLSPELRNIHGSPYKYFRILIFSSLSGAHSIHSLSFSYSLRFTNRLR